MALVSSLQIYFLPLPANEREKSVPKKATRFRARNRVSVHLNGLLAQPLYFFFLGPPRPQTDRICNATEVEFLSSCFERKRPFFALFLQPSAGGVLSIMFLRNRRVIIGQCGDHSGLPHFRCVVARWISQFQSDRSIIYIYTWIGH